MKSEASIYLGYLSLPTLAKLAKVYTPSSKVSLKVKTLDLILITDELGRVVRFQVGKIAESGKLSGEEFQRIFRRDDSRKITVTIEFIGKCQG